ncbi:hypothetical protein FXO37_28805 [Capsicum annuum]|nr:hypothetical protein FXO37_28805 [Capsicum annuum]
MGLDSEIVLLFFGDLCLLASLFFFAIYIGEQDQGFTVKIACASSMYVIGLLILVQPVLQKLDYLGPGDYISARYHPALNVVGVIVAVVRFILDIFARDAITAAADSASGVAGPDLGLAAAEIRADSSAGGDAIMHLGLVADEVRLLPPHSDTDVAEDRVDADVVHLVAPHAYIDLPLPDIDLGILHAFVGGRIRWSEGGDF